MSSSTSLGLKCEVKEENVGYDEELCRFCAERTTEYSSVFNENLHETLSLHFGFSIHKSDNWPKVICKHCCENARLCIDFLTTIRKAEEAFRTLYGELTETILPKPDIELVDVKETLPETTADDNHFDEDVHDTAASPNPGEIEEELYEKPILRKRGRPRKKPIENLIEDEKKSREKHESEGKRIKLRGRKPVLRSASKVPKSTDKSCKKIRRPASEFREEDEKIREFFKLQCNSCSEIFEDFKHLRKHSLKVHQKEAYIWCCTKKLNNRIKILNHLNMHTNPNSYKCTKCNKTFHTDRGLIKHDLNTHVPPEEHLYKCTQCPRTYATQCRFRRHQAKHMTEDEKEFKCPQCGKAFAFRAVLSQHIRYVHDESSKHVCEICAKIFKSKYNYQIHMSNHMDNGVREFSCTLCEKSFKRKRLLQVHIERHNRSGEVFKCDMCGKESPNRSALKCHIEYSHMKVRQFECNLCNSAFKTKLGLKEHIATHSQSQILYSCLFCTKQFNSNANKYVHQKRKHPVEYEAMQKEKGGQGKV